MKIINYKKIDKGVMVASFDVVIEEWGLSIKKCVTFKSGEKEWVGFPSSKFVDTEGATKYAPFIFMEKERKIRFDSKVLAMINSGDFEVSLEPVKVVEQTFKFEEECPF
jgi:hypothetical protein